MYTGLQNLGMNGRAVPFSIGMNWPTGTEPGLLYVAKRLDAAWQESTGVTAAVVDSPVGKVLDLSGRALHGLQATAGSRPTLSQRVNLLTKVEQADEAVWSKARLTVTANTGTAPDGAATADSMIEDTTNNSHPLYIVGVTGFVSGTAYTHCRYFKASNRSNVQFQLAGAAFPTTPTAKFNLGTGAVTSAINGAAGAITDVGGGWFRCCITATAGATGTADIYASPMSDTTTVSYLGNGLEALLTWGAQLEVGSTATRYQRVNTASDYDTAGFPYFWSCDGTDDGLATATFSAGTLTSNMDAYIAVKRNSAAAFILATDGTRYFGYAESGGGSQSTISSFGAASSYLINGVAVPGGTSVTAAQLFTATPVGQWAIIEARNVNLSTMTAFGNLHAGYPLSGNIGGVIVCPAGKHREENYNWMRSLVGI